MPWLRYRARMHRLAIVVAFLTSVAACSDPAPPAVNPPGRGSQAKRPITPRSKLPDVIQPLVPKHGIYAAGGGHVSSAWRVVIDTDARTIFGGTASKPNTPSYGPMDKQTTKQLTPANEQLLTKLADDAWTEPGPATPPSPTVDYGEIFIVLDGDDTFFLEGYGPIRQPLAAKAIIELRAAAGL